MYVMKLKLRDSISVDNLCTSGNLLVAIVALQYQVAKPIQFSTTTCTNLVEHWVNNVKINNYQLSYISVILMMYAVCFIILYMIFMR